MVDQFPGHEDVKVTLKDDNSPSSRLVFGSEETTGLAIDFLLECLQHCPASRVDFKLVFPTCTGYVPRSDILDRRMLDCVSVQKIVSFSTLDRQVEPLKVLRPDQASTLLHVLHDAQSAILLASASIQDDIWQIGELDLVERMSFPWALPSRSKRRSLALVEGRRDLRVSSIAEGVFRAARALGIDLIVLDRPGHWLEDQSSVNAKYRAAFLAIDMTTDSGLPERIVSAIVGSGHVVEGITTYSDKYLQSTAVAAATLGLPTSPPDAFRKCVDKYLTRLLTKDSTCQSLRVSDKEELEKLLGNGNLELRYPLVVKPCGGTASEGVRKVWNISELRIAAENIFDIKLSSRYGTATLIESYIEGPEIDMNFVLYNGKLLFEESSDDFPKAADYNDAQTSESFVETYNIMPSKLPGSELSLARNVLLRTLLDLGFTDGVFHLEARIRNSGMHYISGIEGLEDLQFRQDTPLEQPSIFLVEINARLPGYQEYFASEYMYGVDYYALYMLSALHIATAEPGSEKERITSLSRPFSHRNQYWCQMIFIPSDKGGIWSSGDACEELFIRVPELKKHVLKYRCLFQKNQLVPDPETGLGPFLAYFIVRSRVSREHLLGVAKVVRSEFRCAIISSK